MPARMNRRGFLASASAALTAGVATSACRTATSYEPERIARPLLLSTMGDARVTEIGRHYLASHADERDRDTLTQAIERAARRSATFPWTPLPSLETLIEQDFAAGRTVLPGGWVLAETEARQCALFALGRG